MKRERDIYIVYINIYTHTYISKLVIARCVREIYVPSNRLDRKLGVYMEVVKMAQDAKSRKSAHANAKRALMETYLKRGEERREER